MSYGVRRIDFSRSKAWRRVKNNIWIKQSLLCNRCNRAVYVDGLSEWIPKEKRLKGIVHHKIHLDNINVYDDDIALNEDNLEGLCIDCHNKEHNTIQSTRDGYTFNEAGELIKE